jgi:gamma-glutamylputrescine oxidase
MVLIRRRIEQLAIDCGPVQDGIVIAHWRGTPSSMAAYAEFMNEKVGAAYDYWPADKLRAHFLSPRYDDAVFDPRGLHLNSLNFTRGIAAAATAAGAQIFENSRMTGLRRRGDGYVVETQSGLVRADHVICAMSGYIAGAQKRLSLASLPVATYVILSEPVGDLADSIAAPYAIADSRLAGDYYRALPDRRLLWGGRVSMRQRPPADLRERMLADVAKVYPGLTGLRADVAWDGLMGYARHRMPQIGQLRPGLWYCMGFGGKGMCTTTLAGELVARAIAEDDRTYELFRPFGLGWEGNPLGRAAAQVVYSWHRWRASGRH